MQLEVIYQDSCLIAVNKPQGLLSVPGRGADKQDCVVARLLKGGGDIRIVHRLDCHTSGVMLLAKGPEMQRRLSRLFHDRDVEKSYLAVVEGEVMQQCGEIDIPLRGNPLDRPRQVIDHTHGKRAITRWRLLGTFSNAAGSTTSRLRLVPETGRTHQLRVHCMALGHPIVGDRLYNGSGTEARRMLLHAESLAFVHPVSRRRMRLDADCDF